MQVITQVLVPSATFPNPLWVAATKATLFRGLFLINAARMLVGCIQCGGDNFSLNYSHTIPPCVSFCTRPFFWGRFGKMPLTTCRHFLLGSGVPRTRSSLASALGCLGFPHTSSRIIPSTCLYLSIRSISWRILVAGLLVRDFLRQWLAGRLFLKVIMATSSKLSSISLYVPQHLSEYAFKVSPSCMDNDNKALKGWRALRFVTKREPKSWVSCLYESMEYVFKPLNHLIATGP